MGDLNRDRFVKVIALAESDQDGEALAAVRRAAVMARAAGMSLGQAIEGIAERPTSSLDALVSRSCEAQIEASRMEGYARGLKAGRKEAEAEMRDKASRRVQELEAELEAHRQPLDWMAVAEAFAFKHQRGFRSDFAKGILYRSRTNRLSAEDKAELRRFVEPPKRSKKRGTS
ncbi:MAG: hypothetical protein HQL38_06915 [Alphaproteobacteria bacterium]|nr:hypothetical protein [Alphaproteobacteria bacterium]